MKPGLERWRRLGLRWLKFNLVGLLGMFVQLAALALFVSGFRWHYLWATGLAVECAVLHNFVWHERYTWKDRASGSLSQSMVRLLQFNLSIGAISILGNLALMRLLAGALRLNYLVANVATITALSLANFAVSHLVVFRHEKKEVKRQ
ncbi:MAG: GtrA family protein [Bryobacterales bacterium]|nr:GtrA family protein [Bryobacterales bacterium]